MGSLIHEKCSVEIMVVKPGSCLVANAIVRVRNIFNTEEHMVNDITGQLIGEKDNYNEQEAHVPEYII